ncbi:zinc-binding alcohol dehydrogenase family protein [Cytophaga hutchinsonii]|uniref:Zinc-type alcohol dehydrogenase-like protein n=1 Tax=Cytophaga hutchinsonii (strain ATCC 33406 / DSM 1761 / CIP 103989 / NBRC 15051 / NCIMB 9469 / D465) TaxID=269798 RepID=A0A6N4SPT6_CYTH3|nr:zinc-binding alcohol dehydrogenase family protein [Cytophaga hutchinsonii]ABG58310.1 NADPH:quinone reductase (quinone oxidoreductase) [Cytophaga hutchinsonii ATCC 33406]SFX52836.1 NADPH2:quinone reductase [Cytophaga hutchinsonii ATCC 33406]
MKAIGFKRSLPITDTNSFILFETDKPVASGRNLLVKIQAISVNPVDFKVRQNSAKEAELETPKIIGWDAVGIVEEIGNEVSLFKKGDTVFYAGELTKPGTNAEYQLVDERIVGLAPESLSLAEAAALPLTALTAWEILFDRIRIQPDKDKGKSILIIGGAGGVGSIAIQLAKKVAGLTVIATASRPETKQWCKDLGADHVVNHADLLTEMQSIGFKQVDFILDFVDANAYWDVMAELIKPQGHIASITGSATPVALNKLKNKSVSFSWELMFTRAMFNTDDMIEQHEILTKVAALIDKKEIRTTLKQVLKGFTVENLKQAHVLLESGKTIGKVVIEF